MAHVSIRVSDEEKKWMESYAKTFGVNLSDAIKNVFFERLEDEYDLKLIAEYEDDIKNNKVKYYSISDVKKELGFD